MILSDLSAFKVILAKVLVFDTSAVKKYFNVTSIRVHDQRKKSKSSATNRNYDLQRKKKTRQRIFRLSYQFPTTYLF